MDAMCCCAAAGRDVTLDKLMTIGSRVGYISNDSKIQNIQASSTVTVFSRLLQLVVNSLVIGFCNFLFLNNRSVLRRRGLWSPRSESPSYPSP